MSTSPPSDGTEVEVDSDGSVVWVVLDESLGRDGSVGLRRCVVCEDSSCSDPQAAPSSASKSATTRSGASERHLPRFVSGSPQLVDRAATRGLFTPSKRLRYA